MHDRIVKSRPEGIKKIGRPRLRWEDCIMDDIWSLGIRNWSSLALNREECRRLLKKPRTTRGFRANDDDDDDNVVKRFIASAIS